MTWSVIVHGGAKEITAGDVVKNRNGCEAAVRAAIVVLASGGSAIDACVAAVRVLEDDPTFNAGRGSARNAEGEVEMCASVMEGRHLNVGAVGAIKGVRHPISVAASMLFEDPILLVGRGAHAFAVAHEAELCAESDLSAVEPHASQHDTVGCVAMDDVGLFAVATSTGGLEGNAPGRVGDSPQPGCGFYADNQVGAVAFTGEGESIARATLAAHAMMSLQSAGTDAALAHALQRLDRVGGEAGGIGIDRHGTVGWAHRSKHMPVAFATAEDARPHVYIRKGEAEIG